MFQKKNAAKYPLQVPSLPYRLSHIIMRMRLKVYFVQLNFDPVYNAWQTEWAITVSMLAAYLTTILVTPVFIVWVYTYLVGFAKCH